jgi:zinc/manganese transport system substrate-binding protein
MRGHYRMTVGMIGVMIGVVGLVATACGSGGDATTTPPEPVDDVEDLPLIVATTTIWADVTRNVVCGTLADVVNIVPAGVDSHQYEPSLQDRGVMGSADLLVVNGLQLEESLMGTVETVEADGVPVFALADAITDLIEFDDGHEDDTHGDDHDDDHGDDPHVWFDPVRVASALPALGAAVVAATGVDADRIDECVAAYQAALLEAHAEMVDIFDAIPEGSRTLVTTHESLGYLADRHDFEIIGTVLAGTSSMAETNPADLEDLAQDIIAAGVPALFAEAESSAADIDALAARIGDVAVVELRTESLGEPGSGAETYVSFLVSTATTITDALTG